MTMDLIFNNMLFKNYGLMRESEDLDTIISTDAYGWITRAVRLPRLDAGLIMTAINAARDILDDPTYLYDSKDAQYDVARTAAQMYLDDALYNKHGGTLLDGDLTDYTFRLSITVPAVVEIVNGAVDDLIYGGNVEEYSSCGASNKKKIQEALIADNDDAYRCLTLDNKYINISDNYKKCILLHFLYTAFGYDPCGLWEGCEQEHWLDVLNDSNDYSELESDEAAMDFVNQELRYFEAAYALNLDPSDENLYLQGNFRGALHMIFKQLYLTGDYADIDICYGIKKYNDLYDRMTVNNEFNRWSQIFSFLIA